MKNSIKDSPFEGWTREEMIDYATKHKWPDRLRDGYKTPEQRRAEMQEAAALFEKYFVVDDRPEHGFLATGKDIVKLRLKTDEEMEREQN